MQKVSTSGVGMWAFIIVSVLQLLGVETDTNTIEGVIVSGITIVSFAVWMWGQLSRKDLKFGLLRK